MKTRSILNTHGFAFPELGLEDLVNGGMAFLARRRSDQTTEATGVYGSVAYDISDRTTVSFEGRFQRDEAGNAGHQQQATGWIRKPSRFKPRLAINHALNDDWSIYGQIAQGTNPCDS